jgi:hypothetical protein
METTAVFERKVAIEPRDLNKSATVSIDEIVLEKLKTKLENKCSQHGWVIPNSIKLISRSMCQSESGRFTGSMITWVQAEGKVIFPTDGMRIIGDVLKKNKMGMFVTYKISEDNHSSDAIQIMIPRDIHLNNMDFDNIQIGDRVEIELKKSSFQINDPYILSVGEFVRKAEEGEQVAYSERTSTEGTEETEEIETTEDDLEKLDEVVGEDEEDEESEDNEEVEE